MRRWFLSTALGLALLSMPSCAMLGDVDWARVGGEVAKLTLTAVAGHNEKLVTILEKNDLSLDAVNRMIDASTAAVRGDTSTALENIRVTLTERERRKREDEPGRDTPWETYGLAGLYLANQVLKSRKKNGSAPPTP